MTSDAKDDGWESLVARRCAEIEGLDRWRRPRSFDAFGPEGVLLENGRKLVAFASNDYLGLSVHSAVIEAAREALQRWGTGSGASRLVTGSRPVHHELEAALARHKDAERAIVFPTGFAANLGVLSSFGGPGTVIVSDELNHASIVDGARMASARVHVYRHCEVDHLSEILRSFDGPAVVVTDLVFSMDGDIAPIEEIASLCRSRGALLVIDEAHAVLGPDPAEHLEGLAALRVGTLSKTLGALGGFVAGPTRFVELLENQARSYIFTTSPSPADMAAALAALRIVESDEGDALRDRLRRNVDILSPAHPSPIVPVVFGGEQSALEASRALEERGVWVPAIRPPSVPAGTSRLRVTVSAAHTEEQVHMLAEALTEIGATPR